jgi:hypothetical protein
MTACGIGGVGKRSKSHIIKFYCVDMGRVVKKVRKRSKSQKCVRKLVHRPKNDSMEKRARENKVEKFRKKVEKVRKL